MKNDNNIPNSFDLPDGYFNSSKSSILNKLEWLSEHKPYPVLSVLKGQHGFVVPENYFETNSSQLELTALPVLGNIAKVNPFTVPDSYFDHSKAETLNKVDVQEELKEFKILKDVIRTNSFDVNAPYFEESKVSIQRKLNTKGGARIISLNRRTLWYAAAAVLTITIGLWIYNSFFNDAVKVDDCNTLACIEKRELLKYKLDNIESEELYDVVNADKLLQNLNKKESADSLNTPDSVDAGLMDYIE